MKSTYSLLILLLFCGYSRAQGCSDAGFCSLSILKNNGVEPAGKHRLSVGVNYGLGEENTSTFNPYVEYRFRLDKHWALQSKLTATYASGFLGNVFNAGDVFGFATYERPVAQLNVLKLLAGFKIPLTVSNDKYKGSPLPLDYQSNIGTYDLVAGANYTIRKKWEFNAGLQVPVIQRNKNTFFNDGSADKRVMSFSSTNNFRRKADLLARAGYYFNFRKSGISLKPNILAIYHTGEDSYENRFGKRESIRGSRGFTLNAGIVATKSITASQQLELILAAPFVVRDTRPDGLTRSTVINLQYSFAF